MGEVIPFPKRPGQSPLLPKKLAAAALGYSPRWLEMRVAEGCPSYLIGNGRKFRLSEVKDWLAARAIPEEAG